MATDPTSKSPGPVDDGPPVEGDAAAGSPQTEQPPRFGLSAALLALTCASTTFVPIFWMGESWRQALSYSVPLMAILLAHELGHYFAARLHAVPASPPYFIPVPLPPLGTMGAVILMRGRIKSRNALLDIGASGPLAGLAVTLPVLIYGIFQSPVSPAPSGGGYWVEGRSLLYLGLLRALKGPIPDGYDVMLTPTAFAGWAGLLVMMLNLIPALQLDGGHVAYAVLGDRYERVSRFVRRSLLPLSVVIALGYGLPAFSSGKRGDALWAELSPGVQWFVWWLLLRWMATAAGREHPPTDPGELSPVRRTLGWITLALFLLSFMPAWLRFVPPPAG